MRKVKVNSPPQDASVEPGMKRALAVDIDHARLATPMVMGSLKQLASSSKEVVVIGHIGISDSAISKVSFRKIKVGK